MDVPADCFLNSTGLHLGRQPLYFELSFWAALWQPTTVSVHWHDPDENSRVTGQHDF
jgi:hypothetical protein